MLVFFSLFLSSLENIFSFLISYQIPPFFDEISPLNNSVLLFSLSFFSSAANLPALFYQSYDFLRLQISMR